MLSTPLTIDQVQLPSARRLKRLKLSPEVAFYLLSRGYELPDCPPLVKTPEPSMVKGAAFDPERVDHVIAATGYRSNLDQLAFLAPSLRERIRTVARAPVLDRHFQSSVPGLYFAGAIAANSFGPLLRFAYGADFAARRLARALA